MTIQIIDNTKEFKHCVGDKYTYKGSGSIWMLSLVGNPASVELVCIESTQTRTDVGVHWVCKGRVVDSNRTITQAQFCDVCDTAADYFTPLKTQVVDINIKITSLDDLGELWGRLNVGASKEDADRAFVSLKASPNPRMQQYIWEAIDAVVDEYDLKE